MPWLIDGSNVLGAMRVDRHGDDPKRALVRQLAAFARAKKTRVTCVFDGPHPPSFASHLGSVSVVFSAPSSADDVIADRASRGHGWTVVTSDRGLSARVQRREVSIVAPAAFLRGLESISAPEVDTREDWEAFFADEKNRTKF